MKRLLGMICVLGLMLTGCGVQKAKPPVYGNSGMDVLLNTSRYIQPVMDKGQNVVTEAVTIENGGGSLLQLETDVKQVHEVIDRAKSEVSALSYPPSMANQKDETLLALTTLGVDMDKLLAKAKDKKSFHSEWVTLQADLNQVQAVVQAPQGK